MCTPAKLVGRHDEEDVTFSPPGVCSALLSPTPPHLDHGVVRHSGRVRCVLVHQVRVLGPACPPKVLDLTRMERTIVFGMEVGEIARKNGKALASF